MSENEELRRRLEALEARVDEVVEQQATTRNLAVGSDRDVAALREQRRADMQLIRDLWDTQLEHGRTLHQHGELMGALAAGQAEHGRILAEHSRILAEHSGILAGHGGMLRSLAAGQAAILDHLGIAPPESGPED
ncbi:MULTISPECIES: hypothetical protein [unclassified Streptomyces]|uniref:hypothetical protein n=1 Tax=unclassified Streptomyces TaxID=2593676 RepID=UPI003D92CCBB